MLCLDCLRHEANFAVVRCAKHLNFALNLDTQEDLLESIAD